MKNATCGRGSSLKTCDSGLVSHTPNIRFQKTSVGLLLGVNENVSWATTGGQQKSTLGGYWGLTTLFTAPPTQFQMEQPLVTACPFFTTATNSFIKINATGRRLCYQYHFIISGQAGVVNAPDIVASYTYGVFALSNN